MPRGSDVPALIPYGRPRVHHANHPTGDPSAHPSHRHPSPYPTRPSPRPTKDKVAGVGMADSDADRSRAWPEERGTAGAMEDQSSTSIEDQSSTSIESVASNFMARVQRTEEENANLLEDNQRLLDKAELDGLEIKRLDIENKRLSSELDQALSGDGTAKKDKLVLQKRIAELEQENENLVRAFKEERQENKEAISEIQEEKQRLSVQLEELQQREEELEMKVSEQEEEITDLGQQLELMREGEKDGAATDGLVEENSRLKDKVLEVEEAKLRAEEALDAARVTADEELGKVASENVTLKDTVQKQKKTISETKKSVEELRSEKLKLQSALDEMKSDLEQRKIKAADSGETEELRKKVAQLTKEKKALDQALGKLKQEQGDGATTRQTEAAELVRTKKLMRDLAERVKLMKGSLTSMTELVHSKESHIQDLRAEIDDMRTASESVTAELERYRSKGDHDVLVTDKYQDMASSHRKVLDENKRLRDLVAKQTMEETNVESQRSELQLELEVLKDKHGAAQGRIRQLETWMDEIFNHETFEVVTKNGLSKVSTKVSSKVNTKVSTLPEIPRSEGGLTHRRRGVERGAATSRSPTKAWSLAGGGGRDTRGSTYR